MNIEQLADMYPRCEITTIALQDKSAEKLFYNAYSLVELCLEDQEKSKQIESKDGYPCLRYSVNSKYNIFIQRNFFDSAQAGIDFYRGKEKLHYLPEDILQEFEPLVQEPPDENCILFSSSGKSSENLSKVLPHFDRQIWLAMKLSPNENFLELLTEQKRLEVGNFIEKHLGISPALYTEFWGGFFLCAKIPNLHTVNYELGKDKTSLLVSLFPLQDKGTIEILDKRHYGAGFHIRQEIKFCRFIVRLPYEPENLQVRIFDADGQLISDKSGTFEAKFQVSMAIQSGYRVFDNGNEKIKIPMNTYANFSVGKDTPGIMERIFQTEQQRYLKSLEESRTFIYFPGNAEEKVRAIKIIRDLISSAKERCIICDPYFSGNDLLDYGIYVTSLDFTLKIVTSAAFLKSKLDGKSEIRQGDILRARLESLPEYNSKVKFYVLRGKKSPLHDRFIVADNLVYLLGSSLNEFGSRATTLYKVPNPNLLVGQAERWLGDTKICPPFEEWLESRENEEDNDV